MTVKDLTPGERVWLARRRRGGTQEDIAAQFALDDHIVYEVERDRRDVPARLAWWVRVILSRRPRLTETERLALVRRRSRRTWERIAGDLGVSRVTAIRWERRADPRLGAYWEEAS